jgi:hypothetical protein
MTLRKFLYTLDSGSGSVSVYSINSDGTLNQLGGIEGLPEAAAAHEWLAPSAVVSVH